jgi:hypothetical protein
LLNVAELGVLLPAKRGNGQASNIAQACPGEHLKFSSYIQDRYMKLSFIMDTRRNEKEMTQVLF